MAIRTTGASGRWSAASTWSGGVVPQNGDSAVIASGHVVQFDTDHGASGISLVGLTITGTLECYGVTGTYQLQMAGANTQNIGGAGTFRAGSTATALPSNVQFNILLGAASQIVLSGGLNVIFNATDPTHKYTTLISNEVLGATAMSVTDDLTGAGDSIYWKSGNYLHICDVDKARDYQGVGDDQRTITAVRNSPSNEVVISSGGLDSANIAGAYIVVVNRNIEIRQSPAGTTTYVFNSSNAATKAYINCAIRNLTSTVNGYAFYICTTHSGIEFAGVCDGFYGLEINCSSTDARSRFKISGIVCGATITLNGGLGLDCEGAKIFGANYITSGVAGLDFDVNSIGAGSALGINASGGIVYGTLFGNQYAFSNCRNVISAGAVTSNSYGIYGDYIELRYPTVWSLNTRDFYGSTSSVTYSRGIGYGAALLSSTIYSGYQLDSMPDCYGVVNYDYVPAEETPPSRGYIQGWQPGGKIETVTSGWTGTPPVSLTIAYKLTFESANRHVWLRIPLCLIQDQYNIIDVYMQKDSTSMSATPRAAIVDDTDLFNANENWDEEITSAVMTDDTNWQTIRLSYKPVGLVPRCSLQVVGRDASAILYFFYNVQYKRTLTS